jgi:uncharacterized protein YjiS (DUF1127 family)
MTAYILSLSAAIQSREAGLFHRALTTFRTWQERARARRELARWSERQLHDIGVSWSTVAEEVNKPFWRA